MQEFSHLIAQHWIYRVVVVLAGIVVMGLGYRMYLHPKAPLQAGNVSGHGGGGTLTVRGAAGTFFLVVGGLIALAGILSPHQVTETETQTTTRTMGDSGRVVVETVKTEKTRTVRDTAPGE
jgi:hypothetical protein